MLQTNILINTREHLAPWNVPSQRTSCCDPAIPTPRLAWGWEPQDGSRAPRRPEHQGSRRNSSEAGESAAPQGASGSGRSSVSRWLSHNSLRHSIPSCRSRRPWFKSLCPLPSERSHSCPARSPFITVGRGRYVFCNSFTSQTTAPVALLALSCCW